jgi:hypothetical protein
MIEKIRTWLNEQGFPLEMRTASAFREAGFEVTLSNLYTDQDTQKPREIDVLAFVPDYVGVTRIGFFVECKSSKKPWLLLCDPEVLTGNNRFHAFAHVNENAIQAMVEEPAFSTLLKHQWLRKNELTGYSLRAAFSERDIAYDATTSVAKASMDFISGAKDYQQFLAFPVIVVDSPLIRCSLDKHGGIGCKEVTQGELFFKYGQERPFRTCIRVVTLAALTEFAREAWQVAHFVRAQLLDAEAKLWTDKFAEPYPDGLRQIVEEMYQKQSARSGGGNITASTPEAEDGA